VWADAGLGESPLEHAGKTKQALLVGSPDSLGRTVSTLQNHWAATLAAIIDLQMDQQTCCTREGEQCRRFSREHTRSLQALNLLWRGVAYDLALGCTFAQDEAAAIDPVKSALRRLKKITLGDDIYSAGEEALTDSARPSAVALQASSYLAAFYKVVTDIDEAWTRDKGDQLTSMVMNQYHDWSLVMQKPVNEAVDVTSYDSDVCTSP